MMVFNCKACGKPIVFITTVAGKKMPCDAMVRAYEPDADGPDTIITKDGQTVRGRVLAPTADSGKLGRMRTRVSFWVTVFMHASARNFPFVLICWTPCTGRTFRFRFTP